MEAIATSSIYSSKKLVGWRSLRLREAEKESKANAADFADSRDGQVRCGGCGGWWTGHHAAWQGWTSDAQIHCLEPTNRSSKNRIVRIQKACDFG